MLNSDSKLAPNFVRPYVKLTTEAEPVLLLGHSRLSVGAKRYDLVEGEVTQRTFRFPEAYDVHRTASPQSFDELVTLLRELMVSPQLHFTFGRVRQGANLKAIIRKQIAGGGDIEDSPTIVLVVDTESILIEEAVDPKDDPEGAAELCYRLFTDAVPELECAPCAVTFSSSAGFGSFAVEGAKPKVIDTIRAHLWFLLDEPVYPSQIKARFDRANRRARELHGQRLNNDLIDTSIYAPAKLVFTADPILGPGVRDPIPFGARLQLIKGDADRVALDVPAVDVASEEEHRAGGGQYKPNPELLQDEDKANESLLLIAQKLANPDVAWESYARVMGLIRNYGAVYGIRQSAVREAVHVWASKSGKYDFEETERLLKSWGRTQLNRVSLGELLALARWSETDDAVYADVLADYQERRDAKYKAKLYPLGEGQHIRRLTAWSPEGLDHRAERYFTRFFEALTTAIQYNHELVAQLAEIRDRRDKAGFDEDIWYRRDRRIRGRHPELSSGDVIKRVRLLMLASERRQAHEAAMRVVGAVDKHGRPLPRLKRRAIKRLLNWGAGVGKTTRILREYATNEVFRRSAYIAFFVADTGAAERLIKELKDQCLKAGLDLERDTNIIGIFGRTNTKREGNPSTPCARPAAAEAVGKAGLNVYGSICRRMTGKDDAGMPVHDYCPMYTSCEMGRFFENKQPGFRVFVHQSLPLSQPGDWALPSPDLVVVDENFITALRETITLPLNWLWNSEAYALPEEMAPLELQALTGQDPSDKGKNGPSPAEIRGLVETHREALRVAFSKSAGTGLLKLEPFVVGDLLEGVTFLRDQAHKVAKFQDSRVHVAPSMSDDEIVANVGAVQGVNARKVMRVLDRLASDLAALAGKGSSNSLWVERDGVIRLEATKALKLNAKTSVLVIDADGDIDFSRRIFGDDLKQVVLRGERGGIVVQNYEGEQSKTYMKRLLSEEIATEYAAKLGLRPQEAVAMPEVQSLIRSRMTASGRPDAFYMQLRDTVRKQVALGMRVLIVVPLQVRKVMATFAILYGGDNENDLLSSVPFQARVSENWFGARLSHPPVYVGSNEFKDFHAIHIVSREQPALDAMKAVAGAYFPDDPTLDLESEMVMVLRPYELRNLRDVQVEVRSHPDARVQYLMSLSREQKILQAIDRLRLLRENADRLLDGDVFTPRIYIHSNLPLEGLEVDQLVGSHEMRTYGGSPWAAVLTRQIGVLPVGVIPLTGSWVYKHAGLMDADGAPMPLSTVKRMVAKLRQEPHRAPDGSVVLQLRLEDRAGAMEPIAALVSLEVFLSKPGMIPSQLAVALAHEDGFKGELPFVDWRSSGHDQVDLEEAREMEMIVAIGGASASETESLEPHNNFWASALVGALSVASKFDPHCPDGDTLGLDLAQSAYNNSYRRSEPSDTSVGTVREPQQADLLDQLVSIGVVPLCSAKGYAHLVELVLGMKAKTVRNQVSTDENLKRRWLTLIPSKEVCTQLVQLPGVRYRIPSLLSGEGVKILLAMGCLILPAEASGRSICSLPMD